MTPTKKTTVKKETKKTVKKHVSTEELLSKVFLAKGEIVEIRVAPRHASLYLSLGIVIGALSAFLGVYLGN